MMGACFKQSVLYQLWSAAGVQFRPHKAITKGLRYTEHSNGHLLTILYATEEDWSKNFRDKTLTDGVVTVQDRVVQRVAETFADVEFAWMGNKDTPDDIFKGRGQRLPNSPFGLNLLPAPPSCGDPVGAQSTPSTLLLPRRARLRFQGGQASGILAGGAIRRSCVSLRAIPMT